MPYPIEFRPNTICDVFDADDNSVDTGVSIQLFRPLLAYRTNKLDDDNRERNVPGGQLHRFVIQSDLVAELAYGPPNWASFGFPYYVLSEDTLGSKWAITDATIWDDPAGGQQLTAGFASKKKLWLGTSRAAPAPGAAPLNANPFLEWGQTYSVTIPGTSQIVWRVDLRQQQGATATIFTQTNSAGRKMIFWVGSQLAPVATVTSALGAVAITLSILSTTALIGAWGWFGFQNADPGADDVTFMIRQGISSVGIG